MVCSLIKEHREQDQMHSAKYNVWCYIKCKESNTPHLQNCTVKMVVIFKCWGEPFLTLKSNLKKVSLDTWVMLLTLELMFYKTLHHCLTGARLSGDCRLSLKSFFFFPSVNAATFLSLPYTSGSILALYLSAVGIISARGIFGNTKTAHACICLNITSAQLPFK